MTLFAIPRGYRAALAAASLLVPRAERENWQRLWRAELWHAENHRSTMRLSRPRRILREVDLTFGLFSDAAWLRIDALRMRFSGSPILTLATLCALCFVAATISFRLSGLESQQLFFTELAKQFKKIFLLTTIIGVIAHLGIRQNNHSAPALRLPRSLGNLRDLMLRTLFYASKVVLAPTFAFLCGVALFMHFPVVRQMAFPQIYVTAIFTAIALRWATRDQRQRCQQCLHSLTVPARVGRPSHNFLEWNGTEQTCRHGHGSLHQPEMETSWFDAGKWVIG